MAGSCYCLPLGTDGGFLAGTRVSAETLHTAQTLHAAPRGPPHAAYLLVSRHGLVTSIGRAGKTAHHFGVCHLPLGGLVVIGWFAGEVPLFPGSGCVRVRVEQRQQGAARGP